MTDDQQAVYAFNLLNVANLCLAKISIALLLQCLTPVKFHRQLIWVVLGFVGLWAISAELFVAFACHLPETWNFLNNTCSSQVCYLRPPQDD